MNNGRHKALFLDRDGVINLERQYVHCPETFQFQDGVFELCRAALGLPVLWTRPCSRALGTDGKLQAVEHGMQLTGKVSGTDLLLST